jgi:hypothetical protein
MRFGVVAIFVSIACGSPPRGKSPPRVPVEPGPPAAAPAVSIAKEDAVAIEAAEPFSAAWNETEEPGDSPEVVTERWVNADTCPAPLERYELGEYDAFVERALGVGDAPDRLVAVRISPAFQPERAVSLARGKNGRFMVRVVRLSEQVWGRMMNEMSAHQGGSVSLDEASQRAALARVTTLSEVHERSLDAPTAWLWTALWQALIGRAQVVEEVGVATGKSDGTLYRLSSGGREAMAHSPDGRGVLAEATTAAELLEGWVNGRSRDEAGDLKRARQLMRSALARTQQKESCLRRYDDKNP